MASRWPYPGDSPIARARRVAHAYRARLHDINTQACDEMDKRMRDWGQDWVIPRVVAYDPGEWLTPAEAADLAAVDTDTLRQLRRRGRLSGRRNGRSWEYRAADVLALNTTPRRRGNAFVQEQMIREARAPTALDGETRCLGDGCCVWEEDDTR